MPTDDPADPRAKAHRQIAADVVAIPHPGVRAPCALCVNGALALSGNVTIDGANGDRACGEDLKYGAVTRDEDDGERSSRDLRGRGPRGSAPAGRPTSTP